jgi:hypothetical protein
LEIWTKLKAEGVTPKIFNDVSEVLVFLKTNNASLEEVLAITKRARKITAAIPADIAEKLINTLNGTCDCPGCTAARADREKTEQVAEAKAN